jgi:uncharacterized protein YdbL (DUF1318 family)
VIRFFLAAGLSIACVAGAAAAQSAALDQARAAGQIGERYDGYVGVAGTVSAQVRNQVAAINIRRRSLYSRLGAQKRVSPQEVGVTAGCQLLAGVGDGEVYLLSDGRWRRRAPGQAVQMPPYCR